MLKRRGRTSVAHSDACIMPPSSVVLIFRDQAFEGSHASGTNRIRGEICLDLKHLIRTQPEFCRAHDLPGLLGRSHTYNRPGDDRISQRPGDGNFAGRVTVTLADAAKDLHQPEIAA